MRITTLVATMNLTSHRELIERMNIEDSSIVVNQSAHKIGSDIYDDTDHTLLSYQERGLSRSRNRALTHASSDICVIADDDLVYTPGYPSLVSEAFTKYKDADIILFAFKKESGSIVALPKGRINLIQSMKARSVQIAFRRKSVTENHITFNESFGAGTELYMGEENIFLAECLRKGLKIYSYPEVLTTLTERESSWPRDRNDRYFYIHGRVFREMSPSLSKLLSIQFALRKSGRRNKAIGLIPALKYTLKGAHGSSL